MDVHTRLDMKKKKITIPVYDHMLNVIVVNDLTSLNNKFNTKIDETYDAVFFDYKGESYVAFRPDSPDDLIVHETVHVVNHIFGYYGVELDLNNDEHQAYFTQYIFKQIKKCLTPKTK